LRGFARKPANLRRRYRYGSEPVNYAVVPI
jgi:hypothetical protein